jgi:hypothetical protein
MGYIPHVVMPIFKISPRSCGPSWKRGRGSHTNKSWYYTKNYLIKDQVAPEHIWGLIHQGTRPRINPCFRHGYPGTHPGALDISRDLVIYWGPSQGSQTKNPSHLLGALSRVFTAWSQTKNPSYLLGALSRVFCHGSNCLVPDQEPQECTGGPSPQLGS